MHVRRLIQFSWFYLEFTAQQMYEVSKITIKQRQYKSKESLAWFCYKYKDEMEKRDFRSALQLIKKIELKL